MSLQDMLPLITFALIGLFLIDHLVLGGAFRAPLLIACLVSCLFWALFEDSY